MLRNMTHENPDAKVANNKFEIAKNTTLFGIRSIIIAMGYIGISKVLISLGPDEAASSSLITTIQGLLIGTGAGFITSIGGQVSIVLGEKLSTQINQEDEIKLSRIIKTGLFKTLIVGGIGAGFCLTSHFWLPKILADVDTALLCSDYLNSFSAAPLCDFLILYAGQLVFKIEKNAWFGLITSITFRIPAIFLADYLGKNRNMKTSGIGLSSSIMGLVTVLIYLPWFFKKPYRQMMTGYEYSCQDFIDNMKILLKKGWKLSLQRITEWGNLFIIVQIIGNWSNAGLIAVQPSVLLLTLMGQLVQGFSLAGMMIATEDAKAFKKLKSQHNESQSTHFLPKIFSLNKKIKNNFYIGNGAGLGCNFLLAIALFFAKNKLIAWTMPDNSDENSMNLSNTLYLINLASTFGDTVRVITGGLLFSYDDLMFSIMVSLFFMSALGIPAGFGIGLQKEKSIQPFFILRLITILIAAGMNIGRFFSFLTKDKDNQQDQDLAIEPDNLLSSNHYILLNDGNDLITNLQDEDHDKNAGSLLLSKN